MRVVVAGGTGLIGKELVKALKQDGHDVTIVSRQASSPDGPCICWNQVRQEGLPKGTEAVIQLAGKSILQIPRWTEAHKKEVLSSRLETGGILVSAMKQNPPAVYIVASAVGYYPVNTAESHAEDAAPGSGFAADVCVEVEKLADTAAPEVPRIVKMRIGVVLTKSGGALQQMWNPFRMGLGGRLGPGTQPFPWVHVRDIVGLYRHALATPALEGPVNAVAPADTDNMAFTVALGAALGRPVVLPVPGPVLRVLMGEQSGLLLDGPRVTPAKALATGYTFAFPEIAGALADIRDSTEY